MEVEIPGIIVSLVLGTVHMWHLRGNRHKVVDLIVRHFSASELLEARKELCKAVDAEDPVARRDSGQRPAAEAIAINLLDHLGDLDTQKKLPVIVVPSTMLAKVLVSPLLTSDDVAVSARLESLDKCMKLLTVTVTKLAAPKTETFGGARARVNSQSGAGQGLGGGRVHAQVVVPPPGAEVMGSSWAGVAGTGAAGGLRVPPASAGGRERLGSDGEKRKREEEFKLPGRQRGRKVAIGKSTVDVDDGGEAAPLEYYVGNTTPRDTSDIIKAVLEKKIGLALPTSTRNYWS